MRSTVKLTLTIFAVATVAITSCKKNSVAPATSADGEIDVTVAAKQIGVSFSKSFNGIYGGAKLSDGIKTPSGIKSGRLKVNSIEPYCGYVIDTTDNFTYQVVDTTKNVDSKYKFIYTCSANTLDGYVLTDSVTYTDKGPLFINKYLIAQNYIVNKAADDYSLVSMHGSMGNRFVEKVLNESGAVIDTKNNHTEYTFTDVKVNTNGLGVVSGTVAFNASLSETVVGVKTKTYRGSFSGTMTFLGNNQAILVITYKGKTQKYTFDLITYDQTPIFN